MLLLKKIPSHTEKLFTLLLVLLSSSVGYAQLGGTDCSTLEPICTNAGLNFTSNQDGVNASVADPGNNYGCLGSTPNPSWYYLEIDAAGNIDMSLSAGSDIDFIIYGPYPNLATAQGDCGSYGTPAAEIEDCSYSGTSTETPSITGAASGDVYVMLITNFANVTQTITLDQTGGTGSTDCSILAPCEADAGPDQILCAGSGPVTIGADPVSTDEDDTYSWNNGGGSGIIDNFGPPGGSDNGQATVNPAVTTVYTVTVTNLDGCVITDDVTVIVDAPPTASNPGNINVQCAGDVPAPNVNVVTTEADDITIPPAVTFVSDVSNGASCPETITRTYRVTDGCGNFVDVVQLIIVNDTQPPVFSGPPANVSVQCVGNVPAMVNLNYTDNCDANGSVAGSDGPLVGGVCGGTITRTWTVTDACGNTDTETQTITINDTQAPVFAAPPVALAVQCAGDVPAMVNLNYTDNCDANGSVAGSDGPLVGGVCGGTITRTWTVTDACGNTDTETQTITINDTQAPVFAAPPVALAVQCAGDVPAMVNLNYTDNCDANGSVAGSDGPIIGGVCGGTITRTWTVTDACGNTDTETQTITINDTQDPVFVAPPAAVAVQCAGDVPAMVNLNYTDNCSAAGNVSGADVSDGLSCPETITRTWTFTDACGNVGTETQTITVNDTQVPVFAAPPANVTVECAGDVPAMTNLGWTDNCD
ncbi:MAG: hypothetical protein ACJA1C_003145, partial [Crocinitomicaceae bacterium]